MSDASPLLQLQHVNVTRDQHRILTDVQLDIFSNEILTLIGPNGAGKTSLVRVVLDLIPFEGKRIAHKPLRIGYMPQKLLFNPQLPLGVRRFLLLSGANQTAVQTRAEQTGITSILDHPVQSISGGELQRVLLARALLRNPNLLILDEPAQGVDIQGQAAMYKLIHDAQKELGCSVLMVSHDLHWVMAQTNRVVCLNQHICCHGTPDRVGNDPAFTALFGNDVLNNLAPYSHHHDHDHDLHGNVHDHCEHHS